MGDFVIRKVTADDYESVNDIMGQVQKMHVDWRPDIYKPLEPVIPFDRFEKIVSGDTCFAAELNGKVVGIMEIEFRHTESPTHITRDILFIDTMAVDQNYRGKGIGHMFFEKVKEIKKQKGLDGIELQVNAKNSAAYEMYRNYGFTEKSINMELLGD